MKKLFLLAVLLPFTAQATPPQCEHPVFVTQCQLDQLVGQDGEDGQDGQDGQDGADGKDGRDGIDGINGADGRDGRDGVVPQEWINETRTWDTRMHKYMAASDAIQVFLPQDKTSRLTFGVSRIHGQRGVGFGYAYKQDGDDAVALTFGMGVSGGETTAKASIGWEF